MPHLGCSAGCDGGRCDGSGFVSVSRHAPAEDSEDQRRQLVTELLQKKSQKSGVVIRQAKFPTPEFVLRAITYDEAVALADCERLRIGVLPAKLLYNAKGGGTEE